MTTIWRRGGCACISSVTIVTDNDFMHQRKYEIIARLASGDGVSSPITGVTKPDSPRTGQANEVRRRSRLRYARPVAEVEAEIKNRRNIQDKTTRKRPTLGPRGGGRPCSVHPLMMRQCC